MLNIEEPNQTKTKQQREIALGIDLGTTNSLIAVCDENGVIKILEHDGQKLLPSIISYKEELLTVGYKQKNALNFESIKRLMGKNIEDLGDDITKFEPLVDHSKDNSKIIHLKLDNNKSITAIELSAEILKKLKEIAEQNLGISNISKAVITVPAYFDDAARNATIQAAKIAGLETLRLVNEPTAASLAYGLDNEAEGIYAIYDLGGGTFDVSILNMQKGVFKVIATKGDNQLGGDDIDLRVAEHFCQNFLNNKDIENVNYPDRIALIDIAKQAKESLTEQDSFSEKAIIEGTEIEITINRENFNKIAEPIIDQTLDLFAKALKDAKLKTNDIKEIVLVGGSTRIPLISQKIEETFYKKPLNNIDPDTTIAYGAAIQADSLVNGSNNLLIDVIPLSIGLETMGGLVEKVIFRNTPLPVSASQEFTTHKDGQTKMKIHILQGERELVQQNRSLALFELTSIPPMPAGKAKVKISFNIDNDGLLTIEAEEKTTKHKQIVEVKPSYGLTIEEIEKMLRASLANAKDDMMQRHVNKLKIDIEELINSTFKILKEDIDLFSKEEAKQFANELSLIKAKYDEKALDIKDYENIYDNAKDLLERIVQNKISQITNALQGKNIEEIEKFLNNGESTEQE